MKTPSPCDDADLLTNAEIAEIIDVIERHDFEFLLTFDLDRHRVILNKLHALVVELDGSE